MADAASTPSSRSGRLPRARSIGRGYSQELSIRSDGASTEVVAGEVEREEGVLAGDSTLDLRGMLAPEEERALGFSDAQAESLQALFGEGAIPDLIDGAHANALHLPNGAIVIGLTGGRTLEVLPDGQMVLDGAVHAAGTLTAERVTPEIAPRDDATLALDPTAAAWSNIPAYDFTPEQVEMLGLLMEPPVTPGEPDYQARVAAYAAQISAHCLGRGGSVLVDLNPVGDSMAPGDGLQESLAITPDGQVSYGENTWSIADVRAQGPTPGTDIFRMRMYQTGALGVGSPVVEAGALGYDVDRVAGGIAPDGAPDVEDAFAEAVYFDDAGRVTTVFLEPLGDETLLNALETITGVPASDLQYVRLQDDGTYVVVPGDIALSDEDAQLMAGRVLETIGPEAFARMRMEAQQVPADMERGVEAYDPTGDPPWLVGIHAAIDGVEDSGSGLSLER